MSILPLDCKEFQHPELEKTENASDTATLCTQRKKKSVCVCTMNTQSSLDS